MKHNNIEYNNLRISLYYLHVSELRACCNNLRLCIKGRKIDLINRIMHFLETGEEVSLPTYPLRSLAKSKTNSILNSKALMLKGAYKNDLKTRLFFKGIIGPHFHFTAFGIDWLECRWMEGNPPTYQEFADMWSKEYELRKTYGSTPKKEWAYINFVQNYLNKSPDASLCEILSSWEAERLRHKLLVERCLKQSL